MAEPSTPETAASVREATTMSPTLRRVLCRTRLWHDWRTMSNPDGERYRACSVCGREQPRGNILPTG